MFSAPNDCCSRLIDCTKPAIKKALYLPQTVIPIHALLNLYILLLSFLFVFNNLYLFVYFFSLIKSTIIGTYKMTFNGWPMLVLGTDQCLDSMHRTHSSLPLIYAYVRSEPALAYVNLMEAYPNVLCKYFGVPEDAANNMNVVAGVCDHSDAIA